MYARAAKHYRVAQKEQDETSEGGVFITEDQKWCLVGVGVFLLLFVLIESVIVGLLACNSGE